MDMCINGMWTTVAPSVEEPAPTVEQWNALFDTYEARKPIVFKAHPIALSGGRRHTALMG